MSARLVLAATVILVIAADASKQGAAKKQDLEGTWHGVSFKYLVPPNSVGAPPGFGKTQQEELTKATWVITGDKMKIRFIRVVITKVRRQETVLESKEETREMTYKLDRAKKPYALDLAPCSFPFTEISPGTSKGIVEVEGDTLKICYGVPGTDRPTGFKAEGDSIYFLFVLKRAVEAKGQAEQKK